MNKLKNISEEEMSDFRIPVAIFNKNVKIMHNTRPALRLRILEAIGIDVEASDCKISWEQFLLLNKLLNPKCPDKEEVIRFAVKLFNPQDSNFIASTEFE